MTTKPTAKVREAFAILRRQPELSLKEAAEKAGCSRSAIYRSELYPQYIIWCQNRVAKQQEQAK
jgi:ACT domain-containing protein